MVILLAYGLMFGSGALAGAASYLPFFRWLRAQIRLQVQLMTEQLAEIFLEVSPRTVWLVFPASSLGLALLGSLLVRHWLGGIVGFIIGIWLPKVVLVQLQKSRREKFNAQLVDGLLLMSNSLKAGLSMLQAFGVVTEEMPPPISQEFGLVLKETRMGLTLQEAMEHLKRRVLSSEDVVLFTTAVLVSRETGGDITVIFAKLVETMRERKKIHERIKTLTFMARMQGFIMAMLPAVFAYIVFKVNPEHLQFFVKDPWGHIVGMVVVALQFAAFFLFFRFSRSPL